MKKTREQKGITLVALIITTVVLLVLATVTISSIQNDGIISKAQDVANKFNEAQSNEQGILDEYLSYLQGEQWITIFEGTPQIIEVGDAQVQILSTTQNLFKAGSTYRITVDGLSEKVVTKPVLMDSAAEGRSFILFCIIDGKIVVCNTSEEYMATIEGTNRGKRCDLCCERSVYFRVTV